MRGDLPGGRLTPDVSSDVIHHNLTLIGSWVSRTWQAADLLDDLARWDRHSDRVGADHFPLERAAAAYRLADTTARGKVGLVMEP